MLEVKVPLMFSNVQFSSPNEFGYPEKTVKRFRALTLNECVVETM